MFKYFILLQIIAYIFVLCNVNQVDIADIILLFAPVFYFIANILICLLPRIKLGPSMYFWHVILCVKYFIMPLYIVLSGHRQTIGTYVSEDSFIYGSLLFLYEMFWIYGLYFCFYYKIMSRVVTVGDIISIPFRFKRLCYFTILAGFTLLVLFPDSFISMSAFDILGISQEMDVDKEIDTLGGILVRFWKNFSFIVLFLYIAKRYLDTRIVNKYMWYFWGLLLIYCLLYLSSSRWTILFLMINASYLAYILFGKRIVRYVYLSGIMLVFLLIFITIDKFSWYFEMGNKSVLDLLLGQLQSYFSGPNLLAQTIDMNNCSYIANNINIATFFNDILGSIPLVSKLIDQLDRINVYFNLYVLNFDGNFSQIIPMTGIGYVYLGFVFSPLFTTIFTAIGMYFDYKSVFISNLFYKYVYIYVALWFLASIIMNTQVVVGNVVIHCLSLLLFYKLFLFKFGCNGK